MSTDVIVAGAGPTGLMLAGELALGGARVVVLERLAARTGQSKALNLQPRSAEVLASRGLLDDILAIAPARLPAGHFAGIPLDYSTLRTPYPFQIGIPQARVEERLASWVTSLGAEIRYGEAVESFSQDSSGVLVNGAAAGYLVGCDGARSVVRKQLGVAFPGRDARICALVADVTLAEAGPSAWALPAPGGDGLLTVLPLGDGVFRVLAAGPKQMAAGKDDPVPDAEVANALARDGLTLGEVRWASRFTDTTRQAADYRVGRVFLAGDAAHIHSPAGGQGLNLGLQDAFNLGWKLAEVIRGESGDDLLDTYHAERHPVAARVLQSTQAQGVLLVPDEDVTALRAVFAELVDTRALAARVAGLDHGNRLPDLDLTVLHDGRRHVVNTPQGPVTVRPDGYVAGVDPWIDSDSSSVETGVTPER
ncbi:2-polyprenyl-6-methoxyphenol hydroxylase-like FAD-dependent oxidoreductase [Asanoa ferruginea]|uniref:2-polyprenyl-6-methoxyphenol hydroxylase-like FAD-dependent oxidoreductase n=1 Tax=Asanoa ferruginea TaxID=53367 RepID=A0A3D9ZJS1_9ACTN|nr:FAD-dependent monooxygenase [Asanoa ferruginea]REF97451.1 2-polyprenyl-6-methoxyphenol hydroxylase-like FAD-dependent oxidoreductase [Asanoa ferruginea]GIF48265.1 FAD-dependent oxidoreductase [Asanoa ferruginea]